MKLRIRGNSLRLRMTQSEVERLRGSGECAETMQLAGACLAYRVVSVAGGDTPTADYKHDTVTVSLPHAILKAWATTSQVSIIGQHGPLQILVEKDFACLKPRTGDDDVDTYAHPSADIL